jgi:hypothetical protein
MKPSLMSFTEIVTQSTFRQDEISCIKVLGTLFFCGVTCIKSYSIISKALFISAFSTEDSC